MTVLPCFLSFSENDPLPCDDATSGDARYRDVTGRGTTRRDVTGRDATGRDATSREKKGGDATRRDATGRDARGGDVLIHVEQFNEDEVNDNNISRDVSEMVVVKLPWEMKETDCKVNCAVEPGVSWFSLIT